MNTARLCELGMMLTMFMVILTFNEPWGSIRSIAFGLGAMILILWKGK